VRFLVLWMAGWVNSRQLEDIDFLREENRVLREQLGRLAAVHRRSTATPGRQGPGSSVVRLSNPDCEIHSIVNAETAAS